MNSLLLWCGALLAAVLGGLFAVPHFVDWNLYRGQFEAEASRVLGREVRVAGSVAVDFLPTPRMSLGRVRIADVPLDPTEEPGEPILRADRIELGLGISGLLRGEIEIRKIEVVQPEVQLSLAADGRGNWQTLALSRSELPVAANDLTVGSVTVTGGRLSVAGPTGQDLLAFSNVDGELDRAPGGGPLRFRGLLDWGGERHDLRISMAFDGSPDLFRIKSVLRALGTGNTIAFDGGISELGKVPRMTGDLTTKIATAKPAAGQTARALPAFELRARVDGDGRGAKLEDVSFSFERDGQPQLVTGAVQVRWSEGIDVQAMLESRWLDIDRIAGSSGGVRPIEVAGSLTRGLDALLPEKGSFRATVAVDQVSLGGEAASGVTLAIAGRDGKLTIERLEAGLPGGSHVVLSGTASADASSFDGKVQLRANSAARLLGWAAKGTAFASVDTDGSFIFDAVIQSTRDGIAVDKIVAEVGGQMVRGSLRHRFDSRPSTALSIDSADLDLSGLLPGVLDVSRGAAILRMLPGQAAGGPSALRWFDPATGDVSLKLRAGRLSDGRTRLTDVDADLDLGISRVAVRKFRYRIEDLQIDVTGELLAAGAVGHQKGALAWRVAAPSSSAVRRLLEGLGLAEPAAAQIVATLTPLRLAGSLTLPAMIDAPAELSVEGAVRSTRLSVLARAARQPDRWQSEAVEVDLTADGSDAFALVGLASAKASDPNTAPARVTLQLAGVPSTGMIAKAAGNSGAGGTAEFRFDGRMTLDGLLQPEASGLLTVDVRDGAEFVQLSGLPFASAFRMVPLQGTFGVAKGAEGLTLALDQVKVAGASVSGAIIQAGGKLEASLVTDRLSVRDLLASVTGGAGPATVGTGAASAATDTSGPWPDTPFDLALAGRTSGKLMLATPRLEFDAGAALQDAKIELNLSPGRIELTSLTAGMLDGRLSAAWTLTAGQADMALSGRLEIVDADLGAATAGRQLAKGLATARISYEGRGLTPKSLLQFATGKGTIEFKNAQLPGLNPAAVQHAAQSFLASEAPPPEGELEAMVRRQLVQGALTIGDRSLPIELNAGAIKLGLLRVETGDAVMTNRTTIDLTSFNAESEWRAEPKTRDLGTKRKDALPPVTLAYSGRVWDLARTEPRVRTEDLARELAVRLMERDVEELERLRRLDEQRAREDALRRQAQEEAKAAEAAAQAAAAVAAGGAAIQSGTVVSGTLPPAIATPQPAEVTLPPPAPLPAVRPAARPQRPPEPWWGNQYLYPR